MNDAGMGNEARLESYTYCLAQFTFDDMAVADVLARDMPPMQATTYPNNNLMMFWQPVETKVERPVVLVGIKSYRERMEGATEGFFGYTSMFLLDALATHHCRIKPVRACIREMVRVEDGTFDWGQPQDVSFDHLPGVLAVYDELAAS